MESITGLDFTASACAAGITTVGDWLVTCGRSWLIRPHTGLESFDDFANLVHGITPDMTAEAASLEESRHRLDALIGDGQVLAHNIGYDAAVLHPSSGIAGTGPSAQRVPVHQNLSRTALKLEAQTAPAGRSSGLPDFQAHDAGADSLTCARIALAMAHCQGAATITGCTRAALHDDPRWSRVQSSLVRFSTRGTVPASAFAWSMSGKVSARSFAAVQR